MPRNEAGGDRLDAARPQCYNAGAKQSSDPFPFRSKALIHTCLPWQKDLGTPLDLAIRSRELDSWADYALPLMDWLRRLFDYNP